MLRLPSRRDMLAWSAALPLSDWLTALAADAAEHPQRQRSCILLWLNGGAATVDLWDLKPGHANGGPFKEIKTAAPGLSISEHLPGLAKQAKHLAVVRSMSTREGDHGRGSFLMRTGNLPLGPIRYPVLGALLARELGDPDAELPCHVSILPPAASYSGSSAGFLGPQFAPVVVGDSTAEGEESLRVPNLLRPAGVSTDVFDTRLGLLRTLDSGFASGRTAVLTSAHAAATTRAARMVRGSAARAFRLDEEPKKLRDTYGRNPFGQACLLARRLVERGVPFIEVSLDGWDGHAENFDTVARLGAVLDAAWATLMDDLKDRGLLKSTTIVCMGEFGRTPRINSARGRDHYPNAWSAVLAGGGIRGGQAVGRTSKDGTTVEEHPVSAIDFLATVCRALGIDPMKQNLSNVGRPIRIVDRAAKPIREVLL